VANDLGVFAANKPDAPPSWGRLGLGMPNVPVFVIRQQPGNPNQVFAATYGRSDWTYNLAGPGKGVPEAPMVALLSLSAAVAGVGLRAVQRRRRRRRGATTDT